jgi:alkylation response protein AidB-like acyl-CoA dehydrogenase
MNMWSYVPPIRDMQFVINELLEVRKDWADIPAFSDLDADTTPQILEAAGQFAVQTLAPTNASGDLQGCRYDTGSVCTPDGFAAAYALYRNAGWPALACHPSCGGQGLPQLLNAALYEMLFAVNHAWSMYPGLAHGAYECLRAHATEAIKSTYLEKIVSGEWLSTMCLTEPQAGSDVGLVRARALPQPDGSYFISGSKIFISGGEHDPKSFLARLRVATVSNATASKGKWASRAAPPA